MQNSEKKSDIGGERAGDVTANPGNYGFPTKPLRIDVVEMHAWPAHLDNRTPIMKNPITASYRVYSDNMKMLGSRSIIPNDDLKAETISLEKIIPGREYIVNDNFGNTYLCVIEEVDSSKSLRLHSFNPVFNDIYIKSDDIKSIAIVYRLDRTMISDEKLSELFDEEPAPLISDHDFKIMDTFLEHENNITTRRIPVFGQSLLNPNLMVAEAKDSNTPQARKLQILEAFKKGYGVMKRFNYPADRILFIETGKYIDIFLD